MKIRQNPASQRAVVLDPGIATLSVATVATAGVATPVVLVGRCNTNGKKTPKCYYPVLPLLWKCFTRKLEIILVGCVSMLFHWH